MKYNLRHQEEEGEEEGDSDSEIQQLKQKIRLRRQQIRRSRMLPSATSQRGEAPFKNCQVEPCLLRHRLRGFFVIFP